MNCIKKFYCIWLCTLIHNIQCMNFILSLSMNSIKSNLYNCSAVTDIYMINHKCQDLGPNDI